MNKTHKGTRKGFTLLEILLVIAAIGILAAIVLVAINPNRQIAQARNAQRRADVNTIYKALEQYLIDNKDYPSGIGETPIDICINGNTTNCVNLGEGILVPTYIAAIPVDPQGGAYKVMKNPSNNRISVTAPDAELNQTIAINPKPPSFSFNSTTLGGSIINGGASNGTISIPYTGGLGQSYSSISLSSTGVTGLTASLTGGSLANGAGTLSFNITGTASGVGTATFTVPNIAGATGSFTVQICPSNYIRVPGSSLYNTNNFCVMKYEAKTGSGTVAATTQVAGTPQISINQTNAITACSLNGSGYGLINNNEWMTIARNIEAQSSNWRNGIIGSTNASGGGLWKGHSDNNPSNALAANIDDNQSYEGTNNVTPSEQRRTHTLSNGEVIWDLSGNVDEWNSNTIMGVNKPTTEGFEFTAITGYGALSYDLIRPSNNTWNSSQNMGQYSSGLTSGGPFAFLRGAAWNYSAAFVGVFALELGRASDYTSAATGFRCVLR